MGGGLTLAAARDIVLTAASSAKWGLPEVPIGLFPAWGIGSVVRRVGVTSARRLAFGTDTLDGREVHALGLADEVEARATFQSFSTTDRTDHSLAE